MKLLERGPKQQVERNEFETRSTIAGIMRDHIDLLPLNYGELTERFNATVSDPTLIRQHSRFGEKTANALFGHNNSGDVTLINDAHTRAFTAHQVMRNQERKYSNRPYIIHPIRVALLSIKLAQAMEIPVTADLITAALTHDVIEDSVQFQNGGRMYTQQNLENTFGSNSVFTGKRGKKLAADSYALSHHDAREGGKVNEKRYYEKIIDGDQEAQTRREIVKAADRIDNLLDPLAMPDELYYMPINDTFEERLRLEQIKRDDILERIINPTARPRGLYDPPPGSLAEKLRLNRIRYTDETAYVQGVIGRLLHKGTFLRTAVQTATDISQQTVYDPYFTLEMLNQQLTDAMAW